MVYKHALGIECLGFAELVCADGGFRTDFVH